MTRPKTLSAAFVKTIREPGRYGDGRGGYGLSLLVKPSSTGRIAKSWSQRLRWQGKPFNLGLGSFPLVTLAEARAAALANARAVAQGIDPRAGAGVPTFADAAETVIALHEPTWRNGTRTAAIWRASLRDHAMPHLGAKRVDKIGVAEVLAVLTPIWHEKREVARKVRQRIGTILKWAVAQGYRQDNPAGEAISAALPKNGGQGRHYAALPYRDVAAALDTVEALQAWPATKLCLRFIVLTAVRSGEARGATWAEIDMDAATWTIPVKRMKAGGEHRVPLSDAALALLRQASRFSDAADDDLIFPSATGRVLSDNTLSKLLRENGIRGTVHGMRSAFRDWCAETGQPREIAEAALAHTVGGVEGAYFRSDLFDRRRDLMQAWADYLAR